MKIVYITNKIRAMNVSFMGFRFGLWAGWFVVAIEFVREAIAHKRHASFPGCLLVLHRSLGSKSVGGRYCGPTGKGVIKGSEERGRRGERIERRDDMSTDVYL